MKIIITLIVAILISTGVMVIAHLCGGSDFLCGYFAGSALSTSLYFRGFRQGGIILILTIMLFLIYKAVNRPPAFTVPTPEQQMEDTL